MKSIQFLFLNLFCLNIQAQFAEMHKYSYKDGIYDICIIKQDDLIGKNIKFVPNPASLAEEAFFRSVTDTLFFAITASIVEANCEPIGLFIQNEKEQKSLNLNLQGNGNFYSLPPNGIFYVDSLNVPGLLLSQKYRKELNFKQAIQSGPLLVIDGKINSYFTMGSKNKFTRCGVGVFKKNNSNYIVFVKSVTPINFYDFASFFITKYNCKQALTLESGDGCSIHLPTINSQFKNLPGSCSYLIISL